MDEKLEFWLSRGNDYDLFPRKVLERGYGGASTISTIKDEAELIDFLSKKSREDKYVAIYSDWQVENSIYDTIFFDIDGHNETHPVLAWSKAYEKLQGLRSVLQALDLDISRAYISGRGIHAYIDFDPVKLEWFKQKYVTFVQTYRLNDFIDVRPVDLGFFGRLPLSINIRSGTRVQEIDFTKPTLREALVSTPEYHKYNAIIDILNSV